jgi:hypothetical protein
MRVYATGELAGWVDNPTNEIIGATVIHNDDIWHHCFYTYDGVTQRLYLDGIQDGSAALSISITGSSEDLEIGDTSGANVPPSGYIDDVRIYGRGLSSSEVMALFRASRFGYGSELNWMRCPVYGASQAAVTTVIPYYHLFGGVT